MGKHQTGAAQGSRRGDNVADRKLGAACIALVAGQMQAPRIVIEMSYKQIFVGAVALGETTGKERPSCAAVRYLQRWFGKLKMHDVPDRSSAAAAPAQHDPFRRSKRIISVPLGPDSLSV